MQKTGGNCKNYLHDVEVVVRYQGTYVPRSLLCQQPRLIQVGEVGRLRTALIFVA